VTEERLTEIFSAHGTVESAQVIVDKYTGKSKGYGFVEMAAGDEAQSAIEALDETALGGRTLRVSEAKPRSERSDER
jgi:RNA recognition motif-containing protein